MGNVETRLLPYFNASHAAQQGREDVMKQQLEDVRIMVPLGIQVIHRQKLERMTERGYKRATLVLPDRIDDLITLGMIEDAMKYMNRLKKCCDYLKMNVVEERFSHLQYRLQDTMKSQ